MSLPVLTLDERAHRIVALLERAAIDVGQELLEAKADHPGEFMAWVHEAMPFGIDKAERLMAVTKAFATCDHELRSLLPASWTVLFELSRLPTERLYAALEAGSVTPATTVTEAKALTAPNPLITTPRLTTDVVATELLRLPRADLSPFLEGHLREWIDDQSSTR